MMARDTKEHKALVVDDDSVDNTHNIHNVLNVRVVAKAEKKAW